MSTLPTNMLLDPTTAPVSGVHKKLGMGSLLVALATLQQSCDAIQASIAKININVSENVIPALAKANEAKLQADQDFMTQFSLTHQDDKDKNGNNIYGSEMLDLENAYANDKKDCQNEMDLRTTKTTLLSDSVTDISKSTSATSTLEQSTLNGTSNLLDLVMSFVA